MGLREQPPPSADVSAAEGGLAFLADLAAELHVSNLPADNVEARVQAAAHGLGLDVEAFTLQGVVFDGARGNGTLLRRTEASPHWNLRRLHELVALAEAVAAGRYSLPAARAELERIRAAPPRFRKALVVLAYGIYGAAVAARVGGGAVESLVAGIVGLVAGAVHFGVFGHPRAELQKGFLAAFLGALAAFVLSSVLPPFDAPRATFGALTLLVPAIVITLAATELATEDAVDAGVVRLVYGLLRFVAMGAGAVSAANLWSLLGPTPPAVAATPLPFLAVAALLVVGGVALVVCLQADPRETPWIVASVILAWGTIELTKTQLGGRGGPLATAMVLGLAGSLYGRLKGKNPATVLFPGLMQIAPGFLGTQAVLASMRPGGRAGADSFFDVLVVAVQLVLGMLVASLAVRRGRGTPPGAAG